MEQIANTASTTLNGAIDSSVTSVVVTDGSVFPPTGNYRLLCETELMLCTARSGNTLTVTRGQESAGATSHSNGTDIELCYTKGSFEQILQEYEQIGPWASRPATPKKGTVYTATNLDATWMFDGSNWSLIKPAIVSSTDKVNFFGWTALNHGGVTTVTDKNGIAEFFFSTNATDNLRGYYKANSGSTPNSITITVPRQLYAENPHSQYVGYRDSVSGRMTIIASAGSLGGTFMVQRWNSATSFNNVFSTGNHVTNSNKYVRAVNDGTNLIFSLSFDNKNFMEIYRETKNAWLTNDQNQFVVLMYPGIAYPNATGYYFYLLGIKET